MRALFRVGLIALVPLIATLSAARGLLPPAAQPSEPGRAAFVERLLLLTSSEETTAALDASPDLVTSGLSDALREAGRGLRDAGDMPAALRAFRLARRVAERLGDQVLLAGARYATGDLLIDRAEFDEAEAELAASLALFEALDDKAGQALALNRIGVSRKLRGRFDEALTLYERALALSKAAGNDAAVARQLFSIGNVQKDRGDYASALQYYEAALARVPAGQSIRSGVLFNIGVVHDFQGELDLALDFYRQALAVDSTSGRLLEQAYDSYGVGSALMRQGRWSEGRRAVAEAIQVFERTGARRELVDLENELATNLTRVGKAAEAVPHAARALALAEAIGNDYGVLDSLVQSADVALALGKAESARDMARRAAAMAERVESLLGIQEAYAVLGDAFTALGARPEARLAYGAAIDASLRQRRKLGGGEIEQQRFFEQRLRPFRGLIAALVEDGRLDDALAVSEQARARVLSDVVRRGRVLVTTRMTAAELDEERALEHDLASLNARGPGPAGDEEKAFAGRLEQARLRLDAFRAALYAVHPDIKLARGEAEVIAPARVRELATEERAVLAAYVVGERMTYLFTLAADSATGGKPALRVHRLAIGDRELAARVKAFRRAVETRDLAAPEEAGRLFDLLLEPARAELARSDRLVVVPDGQLWELPFQALRMRDGRYVVDKATVVYAPSLTAFDALRAGPPGDDLATPRSELLALGNPTPPRGTSFALQPLPQAGRQVRALEAYFPADQRRILVGDAATETAAKREAGGHRMIHIAAHGIVDDASPMYSWLALAPSPSGEDDGRLEAREVINLPLRADLTVLSACETGRGRVASGEGVIGLSWAFLVAGSANVLVSQWRVDADSTERLVLEFYRAVGGGIPSARPADYAAALRAAMLKVREEPAYRHPFYWAAFRLVGSGRARAKPVGPAAP